MAALGCAIPDAHVGQLFLPVLSDVHLYFWLFQSQVLPKKHTCRLFSAQRPFSLNLFLPCCHPISLFQAWLHACSLHDTLFPPDHTTPSLTKLALRASSFPSLLFSHCHGLQLKFLCLPCSLSMFLLLLVIIFNSIHTHCSHSCWSIFHLSESCPCLTCTEL